MGRISVRQRGRTPVRKKRPPRAYNLQRDENVT